MKVFDPNKPQVEETPEATAEVVSVHCRIELVKFHSLDVSLHHHGWLVRMNAADLIAGRRRS